MAIKLTQLRFDYHKLWRTVFNSVISMAVVLTWVCGAKAAGTEKVLYSFRGTPDASIPTSNLISDDAGNLYGTTARGGISDGYYGNGTVFKLSAVSGHWRETILYKFTGGSDGKEPSSGLIRDSAGNLYGTTQQGGSSSCGCGVVFKVDPSGAETVLYSFTATDGEYPTGGLIFDSHGDLFGTTTNGGTYGNGAVFELIPSSGGTWTEQVLYSFTNNSGDGATPVGGVVMDNAGNLYGATETGFNSSSINGIVFELKHSGSSWTESILYTFTGGSDGGRPFAGVTIRDGKLYGTTVSGGIGAGVVFELQPGSSGWTETVIYTFKGHPDGASPEAGVIFDKSGNLYGTTSNGGWRYCFVGCGTIFKLTPKSGGAWQETVLYHFNGRGVGDGENPEASLLRDAKDNIYGTTSLGGGAKSCPVGCGVVFELFP
ncbi:MAG TPA: choice-of-anchor tandem repeat GloVer-containing protein [Terriglobales bacterium]|nr:choice-of-anchor tandem repeat GloVer-containing protein [Terriglobales bacterium]